MKPYKEDKKTSASVQPSFTEKWTIIPSIWGQQHLQQSNCSSWLKSLPVYKRLPIGQGWIPSSITCGQSSRVTWQKGRGATNEAGTLRHLAWPSATLLLKAVMRLWPVSISNNPNSHRDFILCSLFAVWISFAGQAVTI